MIKIKFIIIGIVGFLAGAVMVAVADRRFQVYEEISIPSSCNVGDILVSVRGVPHCVPLHARDVNRMRHEKPWETPAMIVGVCNADDSLFI